MQKTDIFIPYIRIAYYALFNQIGTQHKYVVTVIWDSTYYSTCDGSTITKKYYWKERILSNPLQIFAVGGGGFTHPKDNYPQDAILEDQ